MPTGNKSLQLIFNNETNTFSLAFQEGNVVARITKEKEGVFEIIKFHIKEQNVANIDYILPEIKAAQANFFIEEIASKEGINSFIIDKKNVDKETFDLAIVNLKLANGLDKKDFDKIKKVGGELAEQILSDSKVDEKEWATFKKIEKKVHAKQLQGA